MSTHNICFCREILKIFSTSHLLSVAILLLIYVFTACQCQEEGSISNICDDRTGQCRCKPNYVGQNCERCAPSFYRYPDCSRKYIDIKLTLVISITDNPNYFYLKPNILVT